MIIGFCDVYGKGSFKCKNYFVIIVYKNIKNYLERRIPGVILHNGVTIDNYNVLNFHNAAKNIKNFIINKC